MSSTGGSVRRGSRKWAALEERDGQAVCAWCGTEDRVLVDHVLPRSRGGTNELENLQFLCFACNCQKGSKTNDEAGKSVVHSSSTEQMGYTMIPNAVLRCGALSMGARVVYGLLKSYAWQNEEAWPGKDRVAGELGVSLPTLRDYIRELVELGLIVEKRRGRGLTNVYVITSLKASTFSLDCNPSFSLEGNLPFTKEDSVEEDSVEEDQDLAPAALARTERDAIWDSLSSIFGAPLTRSAKSLRGRIVSSLLEAGATPEQIAAAPEAYRARMPGGTTFTETALEKHWSLLLMPIENVRQQSREKFGRRYVSSGEMLAIADRLDAEKGQLAPG